MKHLRLAYLTATILIVLGIGLTVIRHQGRAKQQMARPDTMWRLKYDIDFQSAEEGANLRVSLPQETAAVGIFRESFFWKDLGVGGTSTANGARTFSGFAERPGNYRFRVIFDLHLNPTREEVAPPDATAGPAGNGKAVAPQNPVPSDDPEIIRIANSLRDKAGDPGQSVEHVISFVRQIAVDSAGPADPPVVVAEMRASPLGLARTLATLCRTAGIPARTVSGFRLKASSSAPVLYWNEVMLSGRWVPVDPMGKFHGQIPVDFLPVIRGTGDFVKTSEPSVVTSTFSLSRRPLPALLLGDFQQRWTDVFALDRMPLEIQDILALLLMLPFGALITALFRNFVGLETFGTFSPVLIALSFQFADWITGLLTLVLVLLFGLGFRKILERLKLLMVPRLGILLTLVVMVLIFTVSVGDYFGWTPGPNAVFLPMVILAGMIERLFITFEEDGTRHCLRLGLGTAIVAGCCYLLFNSERASQWIVTHPEIHFATVGALILIGRYVGYRLTELWRFRDLARTIGKK